MRILLVLTAVTLAILPNSATAQTNRILTRPQVPDIENLDRLDLHLEWKGYLPVEGRRDGIATLQLIDDQVYVQLRNGTISALDASTGRVQWRLRQTEDYPVIMPLAANSYTVVAIRRGRLYGYQRYTGIHLWDMELLRTPTGAPAMDEETTYVALTNGRLAAYLLPDNLELDEKTGKGPKPTAAQAEARAKARTVRINAVVRSTTPTSLDARTSTQLSVASASRSFAANGPLARYLNPNAAVPMRLWDTASLVRIGQTPVVGGGYVFFVGLEQDAVVYRAVNGEETLHVTTAGSAAADPEIVRDTVYLGTRENIVYSLTLPTSRLNWRLLTNGVITQKPHANGNDLFVSVDPNGLMRVDRETGATIWQAPSAARFVAANPKYVYAIDRVGNLLILDRARGSELTKYDISKYTVRLANDLTDRLLLAANDGSIICLHDQAYPKPLAVKAPDYTGALPVKAAPVSPPPPPAKPKEPKPDTDET